MLPAILIVYMYGDHKFEEEPIQEVFYETPTI